jgi:hypothetical protein
MDHTRCKPTAYLVSTESGNCLLWTRDKARAQEVGAMHQRPVQELFDQAALFAAVNAERERCLAAVNSARGENAGHKDYETYNDGFTDACNECEAAIVKGS